MFAESLAGECEGQTSLEFRKNLKHGIGSYAAPAAWGMICFTTLEIFVLLVSSCVMWRICATPRSPNYKVEKGFSKIELS